MGRGSGQATSGFSGVFGTRRGSKAGHALRDSREALSWIVGLEGRPKGAPLPGADEIWAGLGRGAERGTPAYAQAASAFVPILKTTPDGGSKELLGIFIPSARQEELNALLSGAGSGCARALGPLLEAYGELVVANGVFPDRMAGAIEATFAGERDSWDAEALASLAQAFVEAVGAPFMKDHYQGECDESLGAMRSVVRRSSPAMRAGALAPFAALFLEERPGLRPLRWLGLARGR